LHSAIRDRLGTPVAWLDESGAIAEQVARDTYGVRAPPSEVVPFGYTGHAEDPTGLAWGRARYLDPSTGWTTADPVVGMPAYTYAAGAPTSVVDPTGTVVAIEYSLHGKKESLILVEALESEIQLVSVSGGQVLSGSQSVTIMETAIALWESGATNLALRWATAGGALGYFPLIPPLSLP